MNRKFVRQALRAWEATSKLGAHPLADLTIVEARREAQHYSNTPTGRGLALRELLRAALKALQPDTGEPDLLARRWRPYFILTEQYMQGRHPDWIREQIHVSRRTYYNEQAHALDALADKLRQWEEKYQRQEPVSVIEPIGKRDGQKRA